MPLSLIPKPSISIGIVLIAITLITTIYVTSTIQMNHHNSHRSSGRVCCLILTSPPNLLTNARAINATWGPRCDRFFFITEYPQERLSYAQNEFARQIPIAPIDNIKPGYLHLTLKSTLAFLFVYKHYFHDFEWFIKADDDTYLIIEHLKHFLRQQNSSEPVTFGYNYKVTVPQGYHSGGAAYVLSRESLRRFYEAHQDPETTCHLDGGSEDIEIAQCLRTKGVYPGKSLDEQNRELFHPLPFSHHFRGLFPDWIGDIAENPLQTNYNCCGDRSISFHYVVPEEQYLLDFLLYSPQN